MKTAMISSVLLILLGATGSGVRAAGGPGRERFVLTGMVVWSEKEGVAWLQEPEFTRNAIVAVRIGQNVGPWKLTRFLENGVELDGPAGKVLIPLGAPGSAPRIGGRRLVRRPIRRPRPLRGPSLQMMRLASPLRRPLSARSRIRWESNRPAPNAGASPRRSTRRARRGRSGKPRNALEQPRQAGTRRRKPGGRAPGASSAAKSSGGASGAAVRRDDESVIQFPVGGGNKGIRELFGPR